jgi:hypothetical protein
MMGILLEHDPEKACLDPIRGGTGFRKRSAQTKQHDESDSTEPDHHQQCTGERRSAKADIPVIP